MAVERKVSFSYQMMTVIIEHEKHIKKILSSKYGLSPTEFSILRSIELSGGVSKGLSVGGFLHLKHNSISVAVSNLKNQGLIVKAINAQDRRATDMSITEKGVSTTKQATEDIYEDMKASFWKTMTDEDIREAVLIGSYVNKKLNSSNSLHTASFEKQVLPISPEFIVNMKVLPKMWDKIIKEAGGISTPEYRMLNLLANSDEPLRSYDIAARLLMDRAAISRGKAKLESGGYVVAHQDSAEKRDASFSVSEKGRSLEAKITKKLGEATSELYSDLDANAVEQMDRWHREMYETLIDK